MNLISQQRCFNHIGREAVARCPKCGRFFCRECVTEYEEKVICASCLRKTAEAAARRRSRVASLVLWMQGAVGFALLWLIFHGVGQSLLSLPDSFHEGTLWKNLPW